MKCVLDIVLLGWCKSNCCFASLSFAIWYWNAFLNKCVYAIHHFNAHFLLFLANELLLAVYFICILERLLDKKQIWVIFLFEFKMGHKEAEVTCNINSIFGPGTATKCTVEWWFQKFCKGDKSLEDEEDSGWPLEVDGDQLRGSLRLILLQLHEKLPRTQSWPFYGHSAFEANRKGGKSC